MTTAAILMAEKPTYNELERKIKKLEKEALEKGLFLEEEKRLIGAISESIARVVERDWAELEIRKCRNKIEELIKHNYSIRLRS